MSKEEPIVDLQINIQHNNRRKNKQNAQRRKYGQHFGKTEDSNYCCDYGFKGGDDSGLAGFYCAKTEGVGQKRITHYTTNKENRAWLHGWFI